MYLTVECPRCQKTMTFEPFPARPCLVFDCFNGAGTTGLVAARLGRRYVGVDLNEEYLAMSARRIERGLRPVSKWDKKAVVPAKG